MLYITLLIFIFILSYLYDYKKYKRGRIELYILCLIIFILVAGLRYRLGFDTIEYEQTYSALPNFSDYLEFDPSMVGYGRGYLLLCAFAKSLSSEFFILQLLQSAFVNIVIFWFFYKNTKHVFFAILLYGIMAYFNYSFEILRESCAISLFLIAWKYYINNSWIEYYILCFLAMLFHISAIITLALPLLYFPGIRNLLQINKYLFVTFMIVGILGYYVFANFFTLISSLNIEQLLILSLKYEDSKFGESKELSIIGIITFLISKVIYPIFSILILKKKNAIDNNYSDTYLIKIQICIVLYIIFSLLSMFIFIFYRFANYFTPFIIIATADAIYSKIRLSKKKYSLSFTCWFLIYFPMLFLSSYGYFSNDGESNEMKIRRYYPYESVLDPKIDRKRESSYGAKGR